MLNRIVLVLVLSALGIQSHGHPSFYFRSFWAPIYKDYPLSWCLADGKSCGKVPAKRYCKAMGYHHLARYRAAEDLVQTSDAIDRKDICDSGYCETYQVIVCKNRFIPFK